MSSDLWQIVIVPVGILAEICSLKSDGDLWQHMVLIKKKHKH